MVDVSNDKFIVIVLCEIEEGLVIVEIIEQDELCD